jgi:UDP-2,3-diacylglucosamine pyrophosphatase LpxH
MPWKTGHPSRPEMCRHAEKEEPMQVFLSDIHFTDGTSGETIRSTAFEILTFNLNKLISSVKKTPEELHVVLLGDIFDVIRSTKWLDAPVRPWDKKDDRQKQVVEDILKDIITQNQDSLSLLSGLKQLAVKMKGGFKMTYVIGNHDWLINRFPSCCQLAADSLGLGTGTAPFPEELFDAGHMTFARHGDLYDEYNHSGRRDASSVGDAIVIELLNKFPEKVRVTLDKKKLLTTDKRKELVRLLKELDNIRPLVDAPSWVLMAMNRVSDREVTKIMEDAWHDCVDKLFSIPFVKDMDKPFFPDFIDALQAALRLSTYIPQDILEGIAKIYKTFFPGGDEGLGKHAFSEARIRSREATTVLYGHTHKFLTIPMDQVPLGPDTFQNKIYFNTGTWRKTWNKVEFDPKNREFIGWHVLTYISIFKPSENGNYSFEVWNGALG